MIFKVDLTFLFIVYYFESENPTYFHWNRFQCTVQWSVGLVSVQEVDFYKIFTIKDYKLNLYSELPNTLLNHKGSLGHIDDFWGQK